MSSEVSESEDRRIDLVIRELNHYNKVKRHDLRMQSTMLGRV